MPRRRPRWRTAAARESALQEASPNYGQLVQAATSATDVLRALRPGEAFAAVILTEKGGWTFVLRDGMVQAGHIDAGAAQIGTLVERVRKGMEPGLPAFDVAAAAQIYTSVFGPVQGALDGVKALTVAPTGSLLSLPFGVMLTGPADSAHLSTAPWLVRTMAIGHVPSAANFVALRRVANGSKAPAPWFGFGDFQPVTLAQARRSFPARCGNAAAQLAGLPPLPSARQELDDRPQADRRRAAIRAARGGVHRPRGEAAGPVGVSGAALRHARDPADGPAMRDRAGSRDQCTTGRVGRARGRC